METNTIYEQISARTGGDIYIGVVGPVRTGKSTFIKRFMETMVLPDITDPYKRERARDELPQSGTGRTIMTAEPKFVPEDAAEIALAGSAKCKVRLVDCVGYLVEGALGGMEDDVPRMVSTPWQEKEMTLEQAAEIGTHKVIADHSTIGLVITTDGSFSELARENYAPIEDRVISELQEIGKPFIVLVNTANVDGAEAKRVCENIYEKHGVQALPVNCMELDQSGIESLLQHVLYEFPIQELRFVMPRYIGTLPEDHEVQRSIYDSVQKHACGDYKMRSLLQMCQAIAENAHVTNARVEEMQLGEGCARIVVEVPESVFYSIIGEQTGLTVEDSADLISILDDFTAVKKEYERLRDAIDQVQRTGYGIVMPTIEDLTLDEPEIMKQGGRYGVRLRASATSIHMMRADIEAEVNPIVGTEKQSEELVHYLLSEFEEEPEKIWDTNIFGKSLNSLIREELSQKLNRMPDEAREKMRLTLERIINENANGLICIIL